MLMIKMKRNFWSTTTKKKLFFENSFVIRRKSVSINKCVEHWKVCHTENMLIKTEHTRKIYDRSISIDIEIDWNSRFTSKQRDLLYMYALYDNHLNQLGRRRRRTVNITIAFGLCKRGDGREGGASYIERWIFLRNSM